VQEKTAWQPSFTRRTALAAAVSILGSGAAAKLLGRDATERASAAAPEHAEMAGSTHIGFAEGRTTVDPAANGFDPGRLIRDFDWGKTRRLADGRTLRRYELVAADKEIEIAPGVKYKAWTYNGRVPGPTIRCREGDELRIRFINAGSHPHTIHFHGLHRDVVDGVPGIGRGVIGVGKEYTYAFTAEPFGLHLYHCHVSPLAEHISKGLYGAFIVDPKDGRPPADELVMMQNAFDPNFDGDNELYGVNTVAFHYLYQPVQVKRGDLVRIYLLNMVEFDPINSFHIHGNFFHRFPTGTSLEPAEYTDTVVQAQGQRDILELRFPYTGTYMFHAHKTEFAELGWMGMFEVVG
jgi:FtsP/CotA-like multicopper oxidase with cupredoxin domain